MREKLGMTPRSRNRRRAERSRDVFLLDVDNTLLDNDRFAADLGDRLEKCFGASERARYWDLFAQRRAALGLADYLGSLQEFRAGLDDDPQLLEMSQYLLEYPFASRLFPRALEAIAHLRTLSVPRGAVGRRHRVSAA
jgi:FMN phosphatase YigB (HAD superfamily)